MEVERNLPHITERHVVVRGVELFVREVGSGPPLVVLHGGPDFDHAYLLPELDRLAESFRLIYYDQRGRGRSATDVRAEEVTIASEMDDLDALRRELELDKIIVLGHSWGGLLAMEYATRHADRVSHLVLMNSAPASRDGWLAFRQHLLQKRADGDVERMNALRSSARFRAGDPDADVEYHSIHFGALVRNEELREQVAGRLRRHFSAEGIVLARAIEERLLAETATAPGYDLIPKLREIEIPTLVLHGEDDSVPVGVAAEIAEEVPGARLAVVPGCGHLCCVEVPDIVHRYVAALVAGERALFLGTSRPGSTPS